MTLPKLPLFAAAIAVAAFGAGCRIEQPPATNACNPNPCTQANKNQCLVQEGKAVCLCNEGFVARPSGACEQVTAANCPEHGGDALEPNDCQARATPLAFSVTASQPTVDPVGDFDFFSFTSTAGHVYRAVVTATGTSLSPRADLFDQTGELLSTSEGGATIELAAKLYTSGPHFLRVMHSPIDPSVATGAYSIRLGDLGMEDRADGPEGATFIAADVYGTQPQAHTGSFEFPGDQDWFQITADAYTPYRITFSGTPPQLALWTNPDSGAPEWTVEQAVVDFDVPQGGAAYLAVYPTSGTSYSFTFVR